MQIPQQTQIGVYAARGLLIESTQGPIWLYGSAVEHFTLYQYQVYNASDIFMGFMQTETPYYQPSPLAPAPWEESVVSQAFVNDPTFESCALSGAGPGCAKAWALRILNSTDILVYGAGFYSFFQDYDQTCVNDGSETCQDALIDISFSERLWMYDLVSLGAQQAITPEGGVIVSQKQTQFFFVTTVIAYLALSVQGANQGGDGAISFPPLTSIVVGSTATYFFPPSAPVYIPQPSETPFSVGPGQVIVGATTTITVNGVTTATNGGASVLTPVPQSSGLATVVEGGFPAGGRPITFSIPSSVTTQLTTAVDGITLTVRMTLQSLR